MLTRDRPGHDDRVIAMESIGTKRIRLAQRSGK